jgi:HK97 family phage portal protein
MTVAAYYRGITYIATQIAKLPFYVKNSKNEVIRNATSNLISLAPNEEMNSFQFRVLMVLTALNKGNFYAEIERTITGQPVALWPLRTEDVTPERDVDGKLIYRVTSEHGGQVFLSPKNIFHIKNFHTKDGIVGQGLIAYAAASLGISIGADKMASGIFSNGGLPSGYLKHKGTLSDEAYLRMSKSWKESFGGSNSGGVAILEEDTAFESIDIDPQVLQFLDSRKFGVLEIARFLGLPPTKLFDTDAATYSNVENANLEVATDTLDAWARNIEMEVDIKLLNYQYGGAYSELDLYDVFRGDMKTRSDYNSKMMQMGAITPNEIRDREGFAPYSGGDKYYIASNNYTSHDKLDDMIQAQIDKVKSETEKNKNTKVPTSDPINAWASNKIKEIIEGE